MMEPMFGRVNLADSEEVRATAEILRGRWGDGREVKSYPNAAAEAFMRTAAMLDALLARAEAAEAALDAVTFIDGKGRRYATFREDVDLTPHIKAAMSGSADSRSTEPEAPDAMEQGT